MELPGGSKVVVNAKLRELVESGPDATCNNLAELDLARDLVGRQVARAVVDDVLGAAHAGAHDARDDHRAAEVVGDDPRLRRLHLGERFQAALDLAQRDALAVDLDQVVLAAGDGDAAVLVLLPQVAGAEPAVRRDAADRDAVVAFRQVNLRHRQQRQRRDLTQIGPTVAGGDAFALGAGDLISTPSNGRPTVCGSLPARSIASGPACVP